MSAPAFPEPRPLSPAPALRWGLMAPGGIASRFVDALHAHSPQRFVAVGSRSKERAGRFATEHGIERAYGSYEEVADETRVDAVYIASPHSAHKDLALLAITAGKHVLIEKPMAASAAEAQVIADAARAAGVMAMEAMWTRYLPQADVIRQLLAAGEVGDVHLVSADFGFAATFDPAHRLFDPVQAGGALLDAGVYPISFASSVLGAATSVTAVGGLALTGVDCDAALVMDHSGRYSTALTSITSSLPTRATIMGSKGRIDVDAPFFAPGGLTLTLLRPGRPHPHRRKRLGAGYPGRALGGSYVWSTLFGPALRGRCPGLLCRRRPDGVADTYAGRSGRHPSHDRRGASPARGTVTISPGSSAGPQTGKV